MRGFRSFIAGFMLGVIATIALVVGALVAVGHTLRAADELREADAIVAISGDAGPRVRAAVDLWKRGYAGVVIFSGGSLDPLSPSSAELMKRQAVESGVPPEAIVVEGASATTEENAERVAMLMRELGLRSAILVTSEYHQRRASLHFSREFGERGLTFRNHPADDPRWDPNLWWTREPSRSLTLVELVKIAFEVADGRIGRPGAVTAP